MSYYSFIIFYFDTRVLTSILFGCVLIYINALAQKNYFSWHAVWCWEN